MTDWERVEKERSRGQSWSDIAGDRRVAFDPPAGSDAGRALKALYFQRRARADRGGKNPSRAAARPGRIAGRWPSRRLLALGVVGLVLGSIVVYLVAFAPPSPEVNVVTYCGGEGSASHYHPLLIVEVDGVQQPLPYDRSQSADIGFLDSPGYTNSALYCPTSATGPGIHALHTHDGSGIIHAELPPGVAGTPTLGNFFEIWGEPVSHSAVWTYSGTVRATMLDSDSRQTTDYSSDPGSIPLYAPSAGPTANPYPIPQSLIFNGQYGGGSSGGTYSGEIIWLNVTTGGAAAMATPSCDCTMVPCWREARTDLARATACSRISEFSSGPASVAAQGVGPVASSGELAQLVAPSPQGRFVAFGMARPAVG